jgi:surface antigen
MKWKQLTAAVLTASLLTACAQQGGYGGGYGGGGGGLQMNKQTVGTVLGAGTGAVLGSNIGKGKGNIAAIAIGTLLGAGLGGSIGQSLDRADMNYYNQTSQSALENANNGQQLAWKNPQSGNYGTITPTSVYQNEYGAYCREYTQTINVGGRLEQGQGRACRQPDGSWQIVQ